MSIGLVLFAASWLVTEHFGPWLSFHSEFVAFVATAVLVLERLSKPAKKVTLPAIGVGILILAIVPWLQWLTGLSFFAGDAVLSTLYLLGLTFAILVGVSFLDASKSSAGGLKPLMLALSVPALLSAGIAWFQWLSVAEMLSRLIVPSEMGRAVGNLAQPNHLATLLLIGLVSYAYLYQQQVLGTRTFALGVVFMSIALAMTQSRTGLLSAVVVAVFLGLKRGHIAPRLSVFVVTLWVTMTFAASRLLPVVSDALLMTSGAVPRSIGDSSGRWEIWRQMVQAIWQSPWWGYGWNQTFTGQTVGALTHPGELNYTYAHNVVLDLLVWNGMPLGFLLVIAIGYWFVSRMTKVKNAEGVFAMTALLPAAVHSLLEFPFAYAYFLFAAGLMIGVVEASLPRVKMRKMGKAWIGAVFGAWAVIGLWVAYEYVQIEEDYRVVRFENLRIGTTPTSYAAPDIYLLSHMGSMLKAARVAVVPGMTSDQIDLLREAAWRFPYGMLSYKYAVALALQGNAAGASKQMAVLRSVFGEQYYQESKAAFRQLEREKYPQLSSVVTP